MHVESCRICGQALNIHQQLKGICDAPDCRRKDVSFQQQKRDQAVRTHVADAAQRNWQLETSVTLVPFNGSDLTSLPDDRRQAFIEHLRRIVLEATRRVAAGEPALQERTTPVHGVTPKQAELPVLGAACGVCGGQCCHTGGTEAWLEIASFERLLREHAPFCEMTPDEVVACYLNFLPELSYEGSCVFHASDGCTLPREIRSSVCNQFICAGLAELVKHLDKPDATTVVASVSGGSIKRISHFRVDRVEKSLDLRQENNGAGQD